MNSPKFITAKKKWLTPYALECGYLETVEANEQGIYMNLYKYAGRARFHVRAHDNNEGIRLFWETFETLKEARTFFKKACKEYGLTRKIPKW